MIPFFNLPADVVFCKKCVISNQRPASIPEFRHTRDREGARYLNINEDGVCDACRQAEAKDNIDWKDREDKLKDLIEAKMASEEEKTKDHNIRICYRIWKNLRYYLKWLFNSMFCKFRKDRVFKEN